MDESTDHTDGNHVGQNQNIARNNNNTNKDSINEEHIDISATTSESAKITNGQIHAKTNGSTTDEGTEKKCNPVDVAIQKVMRLLDDELCGRKTSTKATCSKFDDLGSLTFGRSDVTPKASGENSSDDTSYEVLFDAFSSSKRTDADEDKAGDKPDDVLGENNTFVGDTNNFLEPSSHNNVESDTRDSSGDDDVVDVENDDHEEEYTMPCTWTGTTRRMDTFTELNMDMTIAPTSCSPSPPTTESSDDAPPLPPKDIPTTRISPPPRQANLRRTKHSVNTESDTLPPPLPPRPCRKDDVELMSHDQLARLATTTLSHDPSKLKTTDFSKSAVLPKRTCTISRPIREHLSPGAEAAAACGQDDDKPKYEMCSKSQTEVSIDPMPVWFHGMLNRVDAEATLCSKPPGVFLVRISHAKHGFTLSVRGEDKYFHYSIKSERGEYFINTACRFRTLDEVIKYYTETQMDITGRKLKAPCPQAQENEKEYTQLWHSSGK